MFFIELYVTLVSLKNRSRSSKSDHFLKAITMMYLCHLVKIWPFVPNTESKCFFFSWLYDLENDPGQW